MGTLAGQVAKDTDFISPVGEMVDGVKIAAPATPSPFISAATFSPEAEMSTKMRLTIPVAKAGEVFRFSGQWLFQISNNTSDFAYNIRDGSLTGPIVGSTYMPISTVITPCIFEFYWECTADVTNKLFVSTINRNAGSATITVYNVPLLVAVHRSSKTDKLRNL